MRQVDASRVVVLAASPACYWPETNSEVLVFSNSSELSAFIQSGVTIAVAVLPATLPGGAMWSLWGQLRLMNPQPEILIYTPSLDFETWSGVLEAGGYDLLVEPFSVAELYDAVRNARQSYEHRVKQEDEGAF